MCPCGGTRVCDIFGKERILCQGGLVRRPMVKDRPRMASLALGYHGVRRLLLRSVACRLNLTGAWQPGQEHGWAVERLLSDDVLDRITGGGRGRVMRRSLKCIDDLGMVLPIGEHVDTTGPGSHRGRYRRRWFLAWPPTLDSSCASRGQGFHGRACRQRAATEKRRATARRRSRDAESPEACSRAGSPSCPMSPGRIS